MSRPATQNKRATYPAYKPSGVAWLGDVPKHWNVKALKRTFITLNGATPKSGNPDYWDGDIPWATPDDLGSLKGSMLTTTRRMITAEGYASCGVSLVPEGSLVLSTRAPIGHLAVAGIALCTNQGCRSLVFRSDDNRCFFFYQLFAARPELQSLGQGSTFTELNRDRLTSAYLVSPPLADQRAIAAFLDRETARIDALVEKKRRQIELLQEKRSAIISALVTGKYQVVRKCGNEMMSDECGMRNENSSFSVQPSSFPMKASGIEWLGQIPAHWEVKKVKFHSDLLNGYAFDSNTYVLSGIPILRIGDVGGKIDWENVKRVPNDVLPKLERFRVFKGDILLAMTGATIGKSSVYFDDAQALLNQRVGIIRGKRVNQKFLQYIIESECFKKPIEFLCYGGAQENIGKDNIGNIATAVPPPDEQQRIAALLDRDTARIDALVMKVRGSIEMLREYRTTLISAAVTGKIDVRTVPAGRQEEVA